NLHDYFSFEMAKAVEDGRMQAREAFDSLYLPRLVQGGIGLQFYAVSGDLASFAGQPDLTAGTYRRFDIVLQALPREAVSMIGAALDLQGLTEDQRGLLLTIEGALPIGSDGFGTLRNFYRLGLRSIILNTYVANQVGDGTGEPRQAGLTEFGKRLVLEMNR